MTTTESNQFVRWMVIILLGVATIGMVAVSLRANYLFGYGFGQSPERAHVFGWANVAADIWKVLGLIVIAGLWRAQQKRVALSLMPIWVLCLVWGMAGAIGVYAQDRTALVGTRAATAATYKDAEQHLAEIDERLNALRQHRSRAEVEAAIAGVAVHLSVVELDGANGLRGRKDVATALTQPKIAEQSFVLREPTRKCRRSDRAAAFGFHTRNRVLHRIAEVVGRQRVDDRAQGIGLAPDYFGSGRECALA